MCLCWRNEWFGDWWFGNIVSDLPLDNNYFNDQFNNFVVDLEVNSQSDNSVVKSIVNNKSDTNVYFALLLILLFILTAGVLIKKFKD